MDWLSCVVYGSRGLPGSEMAMSIDRSEVNRALAKAIAYKACGKDGEANRWAIRLVELLECNEILDPLANADRWPEVVR